MKKRLLSVALAVVMVICLVGCGTTYQEALLLARLACFCKTEIMVGEKCTRKAVPERLHNGVAYALVQLVFYDYDTNNCILTDWRY